MSTELTREQRIIRRTAGLVVLLWLACPACLVAAVWTWDWRWAATGIASLLTGFVIAVIVNGEKK